MGSGLVSKVLEQIKINNSIAEYRKPGKKNPD
jgi:hypothetical protein